MSVSVELLILALLMLANASLAMSEIAIVSARKIRLRNLAAKGDTRAAAALALAEEPTRFLSTVQVGITLLAVFSGTFGEGAMAEHIQRWLEPLPVVGPYARALSLVIAVGGITMASVVFGELLPKRLGMHNPEAIARYLAGPLTILSRIVSPVAHVLAWFVDAVLRIVGINGNKESAVTDEEVRDLVEQGISAGTLHHAEQQLVEGVLGLDQRIVTTLMTPRPKIVFLNLDDTEEINWRKIVTSGHSYFPVYQHHHDQVVGMVAVKALWAHSAIGLPTTLKNLLSPPLFLPNTLNAIQLLEQFKKTGKHIAIVTDEFGGVQGLVTLIDVMEAIVGDIPQRGQAEQPGAKRRDDGSWLVDATMAPAEVKTLLGVDKPLPHEDTVEYQTLGGFVVTHLGRIPAAGDHFDWAGWRFEVVDMDRRRVDKVLIAKIATPESAEDEKEKAAKDRA